MVCCCAGNQLQHSFSKFKATKPDCSAACHDIAYAEQRFKADPPVIEQMPVLWLNRGLPMGRMVRPCMADHCKQRPVRAGIMMEPPTQLSRFWSYSELPDSPLLQIVSSEMRNFSRRWQGCISSAALSLQVNEHEGLSWGSTSLAGHISSEASSLQVNVNVNNRPPHSTPTSWYNVGHLQRAHPTQPHEPTRNVSSGMHHLP